MTRTAIIYFSGYGHTEKQAQAVQQGAAGVGQADLIAIDKEGNLPDSAWATIAAADAVLFGSPTYMGGPAWQFKKFADATSRVWPKMEWKDKIAGGFTNSASINGDKFNTITYLVTLAMQHGMVWAGTALLPANKKDSGRNEVNWLGGFTGALAQSPAEASPEEGPLPGDLETARLYGRRVAEFAARVRA